MATEFAETSELSFIETSALEALNVEAAFTQLLTGARARPCRAERDAPAARRGERF